MELKESKYDLAAKELGQDFLSEDQIRAIDAKEERRIARLSQGFTSIEDQVKIAEGLKNLEKGLDPWGNPINASVIAAEARQLDYEYCKAHPNVQYISVR